MNINWSEEFENIKKFHEQNKIKVQKDIYAKYSYDDLKEKLRLYKDKYQELEYTKYNMERVYLAIEIEVMETKIEIIDKKNLKNKN